MVAVAVVGYDDEFVTIAACGLNHALDTVIDGYNGFFDGFVHARVTHHIAIGKINNHKIEFLFVEFVIQRLSHLVSTHFWLQIVGCNFWRRNKNALFALEWLFATAIEEESNVRIFLGFGNVKLQFAVFRQRFAERIDHIFFVEQNMHARERCVVRCHAEIVQRQRVHSLFGHIFLRQSNSQLFGAVVAVVEEDDHVVRLNQRQRFSSGIDMNYWLDKFVGYALVVRFLHGSLHIGGFFANARNQQIVSLFHAIPAFVAIHGVVAADNRSDFPASRGKMFLQLFDEAFARVRIGVATVHKAMHKRLFDAVFVGNLGQFQQMLERTMHAAVRHQTHEVNFHTFLGCIFECAHNFGIFHYGIVAASAVYFHQILIDNASRTNVEVTDFGVAHLTIGQAHIFARSLQLRMRIDGVQAVPIWGWHLADDIVFFTVANAPAVENHQNCFLICHDFMILIVLYSTSY